MFVLGKPFLPSLWVRLGAYLRVEHLSLDRLIGEVNRIPKHYNWIFSLNSRFVITGPNVTGLFTVVICKFL